MSVCRSRFQRNQRSSEADYYLVDTLSEGDEIWQIDRVGLAVHHCRNWWTLTPKNTEGCKHCNTFLVHRLAECDEIWHNVGYWCVGDFKEFWWTLVHFSGSTNFRQRISRTLFVTAPQKLVELWVWPIDTYSPNFVNFGPGSRDTMWPHASVLHWCTCNFFLSVIYSNLAKVLGLLKCFPHLLKMRHVDLSTYFLLCFQAACPKRQLNLVFLALQHDAMLALQALY